ncbi:MAG: insulinase family protein [Bacteroidota bacterium]
MKPSVFELKNGLRVVYTYVPYTRAVHCGYVIDSGGRDDLEGEMGMAHFIEHMIFKGTIKRKTFHILNYLESVGGDVNAYTTKEKTCPSQQVVADSHPPVRPQGAPQWSADGLGKRQQLDGFCPA